MIYSDSGNAAPAGGGVSVCLTESLCLEFPLVLLNSLSFMGIVVAVVSGRDGVIPFWIGIIIPIAGFGLSSGSGLTMGGCAIFAVDGGALTTAADGAWNGVVLPETSAVK
jgi:hypothetical protein